MWRKDKQPMNNFNLVWGKVKEKWEVLPQVKNEVVVLHNGNEKFPTGYAIRTSYFGAYILSETVFPQYQQP